MNKISTAFVIFCASLSVGACVVAPPQSGSNTNSQPNNNALLAAENNCINDTNKTVGISGSTINDVSQLDDGFSILMNVPGAEQPWLCETNTAGVVTNIMYMGGEGSL